MKITLAENIARFRKAHGYTQEELAGKLHISSQAVSKWENAQSMPDISLLPGLAGALFTYYADWVIEECGERIFDCSSSGIPHRHCMDTVYARRPV